MRIFERNAPDDLGDIQLFDKRTAAAILAVILLFSSAGPTSAKTANFRYYTVEIPDDWHSAEPVAGPLRSPDGTLLVMPTGASLLEGGTLNADGSPDMTAIVENAEYLKKGAAALAAKEGYSLLKEFAAVDLGGYRSLERAFFRMNPSTIIASYYFVGPTYLVGFLVTSKHSVDATRTKMDGMLGSLNWIGKPSAGGEVAAQTPTVDTTDPATAHFESIRLNNESHAYIAREDYDRAIESATKALQLAPNYGTAYNNLGYAYLRKGEFQKAVEALDKAIGILGNNPIFLTSRGEAHLRLGQHEAALADLNEALRLQPSHYVAYRFRGLIYKAQGQVDQAIADFDQALRLKPDDAQALQSRKEIYEAKGENPPPDPAPGDTAGIDPGSYPFSPVANTPEAEEQRKAELREFLLRGMPPAYRAVPDRVIASATELIKAKPEQMSGYAMRAQGHVVKGDFDRAAEDYGALIRLDKKNTQNYLHRATAYELQDGLYDALIDLVDAARLERSAVRVLISLLDDKVAKIVPGMEKSGIVVMPGGKRGKLAICVKYYIERRHQEALINLNKLIEDEPDFAEAYLFRGASLAAVGDLDRAAADFKEAARLTR